MALAIISAPGSRGDVNPMIAIGAALRQRGIDVVISLAEPYAALAEAAGLKPISLISTSRFEELLSNPNFWKPIRGARLIFSEIVGDFLPLHMEVIQQHHRPGQTVLISHPLDFASRIHREIDPSTPLIDVHLAPSIMRTYDDPPRMSPWPFEIKRPPWLLKAAYYLIDKVAVDPVIAGPVNQMRSKFGLSPVRRVFNQWWLSPDRILAMYPEWFAPATQQFSPRLVHCGFPLHDADDSPIDLPNNRPIVFTSGTAHHHCREFFREAARACVSLGRPGLLVSTHAKNFPTDLPTCVTTSAYASFASLLPACSAIVHHGGIGTTSQAFAAGIPQIIRPLAFDQFDNATRVERANCGRWLRRDRQLGETLRTLIDDHTVQEACREFARQVHWGAADRAALEIVRFGKF